MAGRSSAPISTSDEPPLGRLFLLVLFLVPILSLAAKVAALALYKIDMPVWDDWREFLRGRAGSFAPEDLFAPSNHTIYATGKFLDSLFIHVLNGNVVVYEVITATTVLGALLWLQFSLLRSAVENRLILAISFFSTLLMLVPGAYWGRQYIAYHQALPILCIVAILHLALAERRWWTDAAIAALTLAAGFAYVSGAFACEALAVALVIHGRFLIPEMRRKVVRAGLVVGVIGLVAVAAQIGAKVAFPHGKAVLWSFPHEPEYWFYILGKVARAFSLPQETPLFSLLVTITNLAISLTAALYLFIPIWRRGAAAASERSDSGSPSLQRLSVCFLGLAAAIGAYLALVAAGRTNMDPDADLSLGGAFARGYLRFHFFWVTILVPWLVAALFTAMEQLRGERLVARLIPVLALAIFACALVSQGFNHFGYYEKHAEDQTAGLRCLNQRVSRGDRRLMCPDAHPGNIMRAYLNVAGSSLSFARYLPPPDNLPFLAKGEKLFDLGEENAAAGLESENLRIVVRPEGLPAEVSRRSRLLVPLAEAAADCKLMQVTATARPREQSILRVFWKAPGDADWHNDRMYQVTVAPDAHPTTVLLRSARGFAPTLRIDPSELKQRLVLGDLKVGCLEPR